MIYINKCGKKFDKIQHLFMIKTLGNLGLKLDEEYLQNQLLLYLMVQDWIFSLLDQEWGKDVHSLTCNS